MNHQARKMAVVLLALAVLCAAAACSKSAGLPRLEKDDVVVAFGDSLTYGVGVAPQESYPAILENLIGRRVVNAGVSGEVTAAGLARLPEVLEREKPALVILCLGGNDFLRRLDRKQAALNLRAMVQLVREKNASVLLLAVPALGLSVAPDPPRPGLRPEHAAGRRNPVRYSGRPFSEVGPDSSQCGRLPEAGRSRAGSFEKERGH